MKASVQYNDFVGTSAADISDHTNLVEFLQSKGVDTNQYTPIGASFYHGYSDFFSMSIICVDNKQSTNTKPYIVKLSFDEEISHNDFFELFKRFEVVITKKYDNYDSHEISEEVTISADSEG